ncbi:MAG: efflux RND transporter permease subunit [Deltaproteobacteria bacterium]|nr:efflux RND transporter permease subunit [Deltaproteobacteria bacterium]
MVRGIIEYCAKNRFFVLLLMLFAVAWGIWALRNTPLDALPDLSDVQVIVYAEWSERSPTLVEDQVTYPIVTTLLSAPKVEVVRGYSFFGYSFVYVIFEDGTDLYWARTRVLEYMQAVTGKLPAGVAPVIGPDATGVGWAFQYAVVDHSGKYDLAQLRTLNDWYIRYWLQAVPGVAEVARVGGYEKQYQVVVNPSRLLAYGLPLSQVIESIRKGNNDTGGRVVEFTGREYMVRGRGYIRSIADIEKIVVTTDEKGTPVLVRDLGTVRLGPDIRRGLTELDGNQEVVGGIVVVRYFEDVLGVIERVKEKITEVSSSLPKGVEIVTTYDRSELIHRSIDTLKEEILKLSIAVSVVCLIFLFHLPSALVIILTLPVAILISFICMYYLRINSNVMSLGGIAIAIGAMVDAAIIMVENSHKVLERWQEEGREGSKAEAVVEAAMQVGPSLFFALLVITVGFLPIFALEAQEGRLFKPLAYTKTFAMLFASLLAVTLTPTLMTIFIRGKITPEEKHPVSRLLMRLYDPVARFSLHFRWPVIVVAALLIGGTIPVYQQLGSEFMPPLYEGTLLYMPTGLPGMSITQAQQTLQVQDRIIKSFPEVVSVLGKAGRSTSPTDPAPLEMMENTIVLRPEEEWREIDVERWYSSWAPSWLGAALGRIWPERRRITPEELVEEMDRAMQIPGVANAWTMPIKARTDMLSTGIRTPIGIKVLGPKLETIQKVGEEIEKVVRGVAGTRNVYAERVAGGYYLDFDILRDEIARYGLTIDDVEDVILTAVGGMNITTTIEGRERYSVNVRYFRDYRNDLERLRRVLVPSSTGALIPIGQLADVRFTTGTTVIRSEGAELAGYVYVDVAGRDLGGYVEDAKRIVEERVELPPGYHLEWSGQYEYMQRAKERLKYVLPLTGLIIFVLIYLNTTSLIETMIVLLAVPFSLVGAFWLLYVLDYNLSVAVWVGLIALAGLDAETGVVMLLYLDLAWKEWKAKGKLKTLADLEEAVLHGAVKRVRPKIMTVSVILAGLIPILWSHGTGADVMKRIAAPMVGGVITSMILELVVYPAIYTIWKERELRRRVA